MVIPIRFGVDANLFGIYYDYIDVFTYVIYVLDLLIAFRTTYIDSDGVEVRDVSKISVHYLASIRFLTDLISLANIPLLDVIDADKQMNAGLKTTLQLCGLLKVLKMTRI